jgi:hypothetical protein
VKTRLKVTAALLVSLLLHGAAAWALHGLCSDEQSPAAQPAELRSVVYILPPACAERGSKLAPGDSQPADVVEPPSPRKTEFTVAVGVTADAAKGPVVPDVTAGVPDGGTGSGRVGGLPAGAVTTFFGVPARGQSVVYLLDRSCSMGMQGALARACRELLASLRQLPAQVNFQVVLYNSSAQPLLGRPDELFPATTENLHQAAEALQAIEPEGGTRHWRGFQQALNLHPDVLYFLTDADDLTDQEERDILHLNGGQTVIHTIELGQEGPPDQPMQRLARATGGSYRALH